MLTMAMDMGRGRLWKIFTALVLLAVTFNVLHARMNPPPIPLAPHDERLLAARPKKDIVSCRGARGEDVGELDGKRLEEAVFSGSRPQPWMGSYTALGMPQTWATAEGRYAPYGLRSDSSDLDSLDWDVNWASLQDECITRNAAHFHDKANVPSHSIRKMRLPVEGEVESVLPSEPRVPVTSGRTAIVIRSWSTYNWTESDYWYLRSMVSETSLTYGGQFSVFVLAEVKENNTDVWGSQEAYENVLNSAVPSEFRDMTVLFDTKMLMSWYPGVKEYRPIFQIYQPMQLFAHFFKEFDHFWQLEMDTIFTGHAGHLLESAATFARNEPRKQSWQRATWYFSEQRHGSYEKFIHSIDDALDGNDPFYGGVRIPDIPNPIGPQISAPPPADPRSDDFKWGVGEDADLILLAQIMNVTADKNWVFKPFVYNLTQGINTTRYHSPPGMARTSWNLLNVVHDAQRLEGIALAGESTMPSFALWHGLKVSLPPWPGYSRNDHKLGMKFVTHWANGDPPSAKYGGECRGVAMYAKQFLSEDDPQRNKPFPDVGLSYRFETRYPGDLWDLWVNNDPRDVKVLKDQGPSLKRYNGELWMPSMIMHPVKTNAKQDDQKWLHEPGAIPGTQNLEEVGDERMAMESGAAT